jgi:hypothetical protein
MDRADSRPESRSYASQCFQLSSAEWTRSVFFDRRCLEVGQILALAANPGLFAYLQSIFVN